MKIKGIVTNRYSRSRSRISHTLIHKNIWHNIDKDVLGSNWFTYISLDICIQTARLNRGCKYDCSWHDLFIYVVLAQTSLILIHISDFCCQNDRGRIQQLNPWYRHVCVFTSHLSESPPCRRTIDLIGGILVVIYWLGGWSRSVSNPFVRLFVCNKLSIH